MPLSFPSSPTLNQTAVTGGRTYQWDGYAWCLTSNTATHGSTHGAAGSDPVTIKMSQVSDLPTALHPFLLMGG